jgi:uncharacterized glyoxalase superfamily protein PhnB
MQSGWWSPTWSGRWPSIAAWGLEVPPDSVADDHAEAHLPSGLRVMWDTEEGIKAFDPEFKPSSAGPRISLAFACADAAEVDRLYAELTEAGYLGQREPWDAVWGQRYATIGDPDGNPVDLFAWLPGQGPGAAGGG